MNAPASALALVVVEIVMITWFCIIDYRNRKYYENIMKELKYKRSEE